MDQMTELRCRSCGGPLEGTGDVLKCIYCGTMQQRVDAQRYIEQAKMEMMAWIAQAIPRGVNINQTETMDPVARHSIFNHSVKPIVDSSFRNYLFGFRSALSSQLIVMPFRTLPEHKSRFDPKELFEFDSKIRSVEPLAMDSESKRLLNEASSMASSYAMILNNLKLLSSDESDRYVLMENNFKAAADSVKGVEGYEIPYERFKALTAASKALSGIMKGDVYFAPSELQTARDMLKTLNEKVKNDLDYMSNSLAINKEIEVCSIAMHIADAMLKTPALDKMAIFNVTKNLITEINRESTIKTSKLTTLGRLERFSEILGEFCDVLSSKSGMPTVKVAAGHGNLLMPMWAVEIRYSFITGSLFSKHSVEVSELILISAVLTTSEETLNYPRKATTDIFKAMPETTFMQRVKGNETSISMGGCIREIANGSRPAAIALSCGAVAPTTTRQEAEVIANAYLNECRSTHKKLQMGRATATGLIYIPFVLDGEGLRLGTNMENLAPQVLGNMETISKLII